MGSSSYHFITHWKVEGTIEEVSSILEDAESLPLWWPSVYLEVKTLEPGEEKGIGKVVGLFTKGWLPYTLRWQFRVTDSNAPHGFALDAWGDLHGRGIWTFVQNGPIAEVTYDWKIDAEKPLLRRLSWLFKPLFASNHRWAMAQGETSLKLELLRRRAATPEERAAIPAPPPATFPHKRRIPN